MTGSENHLQHRIILVFGALRSGTTVFRLMLDAHPAIGNPGEVDFLFDFLHRDPTHASGWRYDLKSLGENRVFQASGLEIGNGRDGLDLLDDFLNQYEAGSKGVLTLNIHRNIRRAAELLPHARIIHMLRDPRDVARSSIGMGWAGNLYHGVDHWVRTEAEWEAARATIEPGQVLRLGYETLFRGTEAELRRVCGFLGVAFEPGMLDYHQNTTYGPPDISLVEQWRTKSNAKEIALVEGKAGHLMRLSGYELNGPSRHPGIMERFGLRVENRFGIWRMGIQRFGLRTYFLEKLTRYLGMERHHQRLRARMREETTQYIK